ncbi:MAG: GumC family protein [Pyrinomonadaceae bacterium]
MEQEQRLTTLPRVAELRHNTHEYSGAYGGAYSDEVVEGRRTVQQYFNIVYKRLPLILALTILVTAAAAFYMFRQPSEFLATTQMVIEPRKPKVTSKDSININFGNDVNYYNTQLELLKNPELMKKVVISLGLYREKGLAGKADRGVFASIRSLFSRSKTTTEEANALPVISDTEQLGTNREKNVLSPEEEIRANVIVGDLVGKLTIVPQERTNLVNVNLKHEKPDLAAKVTDKIAELFIEEDKERETQGERKAIEDLTKSIEELKETIQQQEGELMAQMRESNLPLLEKGQDLAATRLGSMSESYMKAMETRRQLEARLNAADAANRRGEAVNIPDIADSKVYQDTIRLNTERKAKLQDQIRDIEKQIQQTEVEKSELLVKYTEAYPEVGKKDAKIASLKETKEKTEKEVSKIIETDQKKIEREAVGGALVSLRAQLDAARKQEAQSQAAYDQEAASANVQGQAQTKMITLKREIETNRSLLDTYTQRQKEQELSKANDAPENIKIAANAIAPTEPIGPARGRNIFVAFLFSLAAGIGLAFLMDYLDDSVRTSEDIGRHLGLPTLALIPHHGVAERRRMLAGQNSGGAISPSAALITLDERNSPMAEAYRHLRTSLLFSSAGKPPQSILVTSSQPSEGKTTTAINTAITLAQSDADVVIIDCDLRRPRLHSYFEMDNTQGLTNYLSGERNTEHLLKSCKELPRLKVITSGPIPPNPAELLSSNEMKNLMQFLRGKFKHIIVDSPPAISFTDAAILSTVVDGTILVAMANRSSLHLMRRFKQRAGAIGARIYGVVLNGIKSGSIEYEYYGAGYYEYYQKGSDDDSTPIMETNGRSKAETDI